MQNLESLSDIISALFNLGFTEHFYIQDGQLHNSGLVISKLHEWVHCHWHDPATDEVVRLNCCISSCGKKGVYID